MSKVRYFLAITISLCWGVLWLSAEEQNQQSEVHFSSESNSREARLRYEFFRDSIMVDSIVKEVAASRFFDSQKDNYNHLAQFAKACIQIKIPALIALLDERTAQLQSNVDSLQFIVNDFPYIDNTTWPVELLNNTESVFVITDSIDVNTLHPALRPYYQTICVVRQIYDGLNQVDNTIEAIRRSSQGVDDEAFKQKVKDVITVQMFDIYNLFDELNTDVLSIQQKDFVGKLEVHLVEIFSDYQLAD